MKLISWNVNGIRGRFGEVMELANTYRPDYLCLQKVRCNSGREEFELPGYRALYSEDDSGSWSGVMTYARISEKEDGQSESHLPIRIEAPELSREGHLQAYQSNGFALVNVYVPFANAALAGATEYRKDWDDGFREFIKATSKEMPVIVCGDQNVVHTAKDTFESRLEQQRPNFTKWERDNFERLLRESDLVDAFRELHPDEHAATFYGNFRNAVLGNRIDYFLVSRSMMERVTGAEILSDFGTGQSVPILLEMNA